MHTACMLTVSHSAGGRVGWTPPPWMETPTGCRPPHADFPLVMWPVIHAGKPTPPPPTEWQTGVKTLLCPKLCLRAVIRLVHSLLTLNKYSTLLRACTVALTLTECNYVYHVVFLACKSGTLREALHNVWQYNGKKHNQTNMEPNYVGNWSRSVHSCFVSGLD